MSDLYLILRHRLEAMTDWVMIDTDVLRRAREQVGLSYEAVARQLPVSSKTYERWEKRGRVPQTSVTRLAEILALEIEWTPAEPVRTTVLAPMRDVDIEIIARLERIEQLLRKRVAG